MFQKVNYEISRKIKKESDNLDLEMCDSLDLE